MNKQKEWGVVPHLEVHADTLTSLKAVCTIALTYHPSAKGWLVKEHSDGVPQLLIFWSEDSHMKEFISEIDDAEELAQMIWKWLKVKGRYDKSEAYDTDGDLKEGFIATTEDMGNWRSMLKIIPEYIVYGK
ncbi:hypothetical protein D3C87_324560 [compost metagenome]